MPNRAEGRGTAQGMQAAGNGSQAKIDRAMVRWTSAVAVFTGLLVAATVISDYFIYSELAENKAEHLLTREQLRAFLTAPSFSFVQGNNAKTGQPNFAIILTFQNVGGTRTAWAHGWASVHYFMGGVPNNFDYTHPYEKIESGTDTIVPANGFMSAGVGLSFDDFKHAIKSGVVLIWGANEYATIYEPDKKSPTSFCFALSFTKKDIDAKVNPASSAEKNINENPTQLNTQKTSIDELIEKANSPGALIDLVGISTTPYKPECNYTR